MKKSCLSYGIVDFVHERNAIPFTPVRVDEMWFMCLKVLQLHEFVEISSISQLSTLLHT